MITRYRVWMDGRALDAVDEAVCILDIQESAPGMETKAVTPARGDGTRLLRRSRKSLEVTISLAIREPDIARRKEIAGRINAWAQGAYLSINDRPGQRLCVTVTEPLAVSSALKWTDTLRLTFTAYESPWWEEAFASTATMAAGVSGKTALSLPGNGAHAPVDATAAAHADVNALTLTCGETHISFAELGMAAGETLRIRYEGGVQRIEITATDGTVRGALAKRTTDSHDDLLAVSGRPTAVSYTADGSVRVTFSGRGRFA